MLKPPAEMMLRALVPSRIHLFGRLDKLIQLRLRRHGFGTAVPGDDDRRRGAAIFHGPRNLPTLQQTVDKCRGVTVSGTKGFQYSGLEDAAGIGTAILGIGDRTLGSVLDHHDFRAMT